MSELEERRGTYRAGLAITLRSTAAAYGYTLTIATTVATLIANQGAPTMVELYLFIFGGSLAFAALELALRLVEPAVCEVDHVYPLAGALNVVSVAGAFSAASAVAHGPDGMLAWLLAPLAASVVYFALIAAEVAIIDRLRRPVPS